MGAAHEHSASGSEFESEASAHESDLAETMPLPRAHPDPDPPPIAAAPPPPITAVPPPPPVSPPLPVRDPTPSHRLGQSRRAKRRKKRTPWWELPLLVAIAIAVAVLIKTFLVQPFYIPSESMETTLHGCAGCSGDRIIVNKPIYDLRDPHPGDIVVFRAPSDQWFNEPLPTRPSNPILKGLRWFGQLVGFVPPDEHDLVKRVIAIGGQTIKCCDSNGDIQVSNSGPAGPWRSLVEPYVSFGLDGPAAAFGPVTVPKDRLWVMGDNRSHSEDSRWHYLNDYKGDAVNSTVPNSRVIGKAVLIAWPPSRWRTLGTPATFKTSATAALPTLAGSAATVLPIFLIRRRRRHKSTDT
jgi:signal peptidase I